MADMFNVLLNVCNISYYYQISKNFSYPTINNNNTLEYKQFFKYKVECYHRYIINTKLMHHKHYYCYHLMNGKQLNVCILDKGHVC